MNSIFVDMSDYDVVFVGYPVWATDVLGLSVPFFRGMISLERPWFLLHMTDMVLEAAAHHRFPCPGAEVAAGLAVKAKDVPSARDTVKQWVEGLGISFAEGGRYQRQTVMAVRITIGDRILDGVLYNNTQSQQFIAMLPRL